MDVHYHNCFRIQLDYNKHLLKRHTLDRMINLSSRQYLEEIPVYHFLMHYVKQIQHDYRELQAYLLYDKNLILMPLFLLTVFRPFQNENENQTHLQQRSHD